MIANMGTLWLPSHLAIFNSVTNDVSRATESPHVKGALFFFLSFFLLLGSHYTWRFLAEP